MIIYTCTAFGCIEIIQVNFKGIDDSPWFFEDLNEFASTHCKLRGYIYVFSGTYRKLKNQKAIFKGKIKRINPFNLN